MAKADIRTIPACAAYTAEYDVHGIEDFFDLETGGNILYDLQYLMEDENPEVTVPEIGEDYNFFEFPMKDNGDGTVHVKYFDMVDKKGIDNAQGAYRFVDLPEIKAAVMKTMGPYSAVDAGYQLLLEWVKDNGYEVCGPARISAVNGPWDRDDPADYCNEVQIPIR